MARMKQPKVGDYITFKAATRWNCGTVRRKVVAISSMGIEVRYGGWSNFVVRPNEIKKVEAANILTLPPLPEGNYERGFYQCKSKKCGKACFKDYVPYSLSNPIMTLPCGCLIVSHPTNHLRSITRAEAVRLWKKEGYTAIIDLSVPKKAKAA